LSSKCILIFTGKQDKHTEVEHHCSETIYYTYFLITLRLKDCIDLNNCVA